MFRQSLLSLIKQVRSTPDGEPLHKLINDTADGIKKSELHHKDASVKVGAISKLIYLNLLGHDITYAAFPIIEVMALPKYKDKRIGFLAACQSFTKNTPEILLCTNLLKKQLSQASSPVTLGLALNCLSNIVTEDLSRSLLNDLFRLLKSPSPVVRKKATLVIYKFVLAYPQGLRQAYPLLKAQFNDSDPSVISCAVNVLCELASKNAKNYLQLVPALYQILSQSTNNWMMIKVVKLFNLMVPYEPRLAKKLIAPLKQIVETTMAKSLQYEAMYTITTCLKYTATPSKKDPNVKKQPKSIGPAVALCSENLGLMVQDNDQNLKFLGLAGLVQLMASHPQIVAQHSKIVLSCLHDEDITIRFKALQLIGGIVTKATLPKIVMRLLAHLNMNNGAEIIAGGGGDQQSLSNEASSQTKTGNNTTKVDDISTSEVYRENIISSIVDMCSSNNYSRITNFAWYVDILVRLGKVSTTVGNSRIIAEQLRDIAIRVEAVRPFVVRLLTPLIFDVRGRGRSSNVNRSQVLLATAEICGEFCEHIPWDSELHFIEGRNEFIISKRNANAAAVGFDNTTGMSDPPEIIEDTLLEAMLHPHLLTLPSAVQSAFLSNVVKCYNGLAKHLMNSSSRRNIPIEDIDTELEAQGIRMMLNIRPFLVSPLIETQQRATTVVSLLNTIGIKDELDKRAAVVAAGDEEDTDDDVEATVRSNEGQQEKRKDENTTTTTGDNSKQLLNADPSTSSSSSSSAGNDLLGMTTSTNMTMPSTNMEMTTGSSAMDDLLGFGTMSSSSPVITTTAGDPKDASNSVSLLDELLPSSEEQKQNTTSVSSGGVTTVPVTTVPVITPVIGFVSSNVNQEEEVTFRGTNALIQLLDDFFLPRLEAVGVNAQRRVAKPSILSNEIVLPMLMKNGVGSEEKTHYYNDNRYESIFANQWRKMFQLPLSFVPSFHHRMLEEEKQRELMLSVRGQDNKGISDGGGRNDFQNSTTSPIGNGGGSLYPASTRQQRSESQNNYSEHRAKHVTSNTLSEEEINKIPMNTLELNPQEINQMITSSAMSSEVSQYANVNYTIKKVQGDDEDEIDDLNETNTSIDQFGDKIDLADLDLGQQESFGGMMSGGDQGSGGPGNPSSNVESKPKKVKKEKKEKKDKKKKKKKTSKKSKKEK
eukprot:g2384.t1